jgi:beta-glucosidase
VTPARLLFPALRWKAETGFEHERPAIDRALAAGVGGFIIFGGPGTAVRALTTSLQAGARRPLLIAADLERGAGQQFDGLTELPPPLALASLDDPLLIEAAGALTALEARSVGVDWVLAPVADLDLEPENPIVQTRAFGADALAVSRWVSRWIAGCQSAGALACAKHYPGHGRTRHDSHDRLPIVGAAGAELEADLTPFRAAVAAGVASVMTAHVAYPALDPTDRPATISPPIIGRLRRELGFDGLVVSDALIMEAVRGEGGVEAAAVEALRAGVDGLLYPPSLETMLAALERAIARDRPLQRPVDQALGRQDAALDLARRPPAGLRDAELGRRTAGRLLAAAPPAGLTLRPPVELVIVDDDRGGVWPAGPTDAVERSLVRRGVPLGPGGSRVLLAFAEPRASKGRAGFGPESTARLGAAAPGAALAVLFAHPRLATAFPGDAPVLVAWHRQRVMQEAVADWIAERLR